MAGILDLKGGQADRGLREPLCSRLVHRGPDAEGVHLDGPAGVGRRRPRILVLSSGCQPMANEDGTIWVTFIGEISNSQEVRPGLERIESRDSRAAVEGWLRRAGLQDVTVIPNCGWVGSGRATRSAQPGTSAPEGRP